MLETISWNEFWLAAAIIASAYYVITMIYFFGREIARLVINRNVHDTAPTSPKTDSRHDTLMGEAKYHAHGNPDHLHQLTTTMENMIVVPQERPEEPFNVVTPDAHSQAEMVSSLLMEIETVLKALPISDKSQSATLLATLLANYAQLVGTEFQEEITNHIHDACLSRCTFELDVTEVRAWWPPSNNFTGNTK